eukprot:GFUD01054544.1.p1 GENE.GFUD01054544.1~~GFUD01054544.1.p1  ORF type:complete len:259 (+),score=40.10 GFUD01054544.1:41-817(+)
MYSSLLLFISSIWLVTCRDIGTDRVVIKNAEVMDEDNTETIEYELSEVENFENIMQVIDQSILTFEDYLYNSSFYEPETLVGDFKQHFASLPEELRDHTEICNKEQEIMEFFIKSNQGYVFNQSVGDHGHCLCRHWIFEECHRKDQALYYSQNLKEENISRTIEYEISEVENGVNLMQAIDQSILRFDDYLYNSSFYEPETLVSDFKRHSLSLPEEVRNHTEICNKEQEIMEFYIRSNQGYIFNHPVSWTLSLQTLDL